MVSVSFRAGAMDSARDILNNPQAQSRPQAGQGAQAGSATDEFVKPKKKHGFLKAAVGTIVGAAVVAGALFAGHKYGAFTKLVEAGAKDGAGAVAKYAGKAAAGLNVAGEWIATKGKAVVEFAKNIFKKGGEGAASA